MIYFSIVYLCMAGLFLFLLEDRFRVWTTVSGTAAVYILCLMAALVLRRGSTDPGQAGQLPCIVGAALFFLSSLLLYTNNVLQKLFLALLSLCNFTFLSFFLPLLLGVLPRSAAGVFSGVFSVLCTVLFNLLMGLCLYRPIRHFSDRGASGFLVGMCLVLVFLYSLCLGKMDFLFRSNIPAARLLLATVIYCAVIFGFRSIYQAGRFREHATLDAAREHMLEMESGDFADMLTAVREVRAAQKAGEYALDTISVMLADGADDQVPTYIASAKRSAAQNPILETYHENPYLNAVIATKAAFAAQNGISFECNAVTDNAPLKTAEICVIVNEMLTRACLDAAEYPGDRRVRFTVLPAGGYLRMEAVYSGTLPEPDRFSFQGKKAADVARWLFEDSPRKEGELRGLDNTREIVDRRSGKLTVSASGKEEVILHLEFRY